MTIEPLYTWWVKWPVDMYVPISHLVPRGYTWVDVVVDKLVRPSRTTPIVIVCIRISEETFFNWMASDWEGLILDFVHTTSLSTVFIPQSFRAVLPNWPFRSTVQPWVSVVILTTCTWISLSNNNPGTPWTSSTSVARIDSVAMRRGFRGQIYFHWVSCWE